MKTRYSICRFILGGMLAAASVSLASAQAPAHVSSVDAGRLFGDACSPCHGNLGDGNGPGAPRLGSPQPRDFTAGVFKFRSTPTGSLPTDEDLFRSISRGVPGTWMPAWEGLLTPAQRWALVAYIKEFSEYFGEEEPDPPVEIPPAPGGSPALVGEGRFVYAMLGCAQCHGTVGRGDGPSASDLEDDWGRQIRPYDFTRGNYKNGSDPTDIYRTLVTGLSGSPMPAFERGMVAYPGGADGDVETARDIYDDEAILALQAYLAGQPTQAALDAMPDPDVERLVHDRLWALVYYLRSLDRGRGLFYRLFRENPDFQEKR